MQLVLLSDTHGRHEEVAVPGGDVLVHAGDFMTGGEDFQELKSFAKWFHAQPHERKVIIAGNHDVMLEKLPYIAKEIFAGVDYLLDSGVEIGGLQFWGSPYQPEFFDWAFNVPRGEALRRHWNLIPDSTDVLVTHAPPRGILDTVKTGWDHLGCDDLADAVARVKPRLHVFGHIHGGAGILANNGTVFVNASVVDEAYQVQRAGVQITI